MQGASVLSPKFIEVLTANIKITSEGVVKVLDFGLAKVLEDEPPPSSLANSPTLTLGHTHAGMILGNCRVRASRAIGRPPRAKPCS